MNGAGDRWRCTGGKYSPQFITTKMADVLARFLTFAGGTSQVLLRCTWDEKSRQPVTTTQIIAGRSVAYEKQA